MIPAAATDRGSAARTALLLFAFALALRLLFWWAGPDGGPGWHVGFQGDAPIWREQAERLARGTPDAELRLPWRAPAMLWIVAALWDGGARDVLVRLCFAVAGAAIAPLLWLLLRRAVEPATAALAAGLCAASSNLLLLSSSAQVAALYVPLSLVALCLQARLGAPHRAWLAAVFGALHGGLCLLRTENLLVFAVLLAVARRGGARWSTLAVAVAAGFAAVLPWQFAAARKVADFNAAAAPWPARSLPWDDAAVQAVHALPAFAQRGVVELVDATVRHRGGARVRAADLAIVRDAYGSWPEPLPVPVIALNGPYNFFLANSRESDGGFSRAAFDRDPPLVGGADRYPVWLRLRPGERRRFSLGYPPHLDVALHGHARGLAELRADPAAAARRLAGKLAQAAAGATGGLGGYALPIGLSGTRRAVDLVTAVGPWPALWRCTVLALAGFGWWRLRRQRALGPLFAFGAVQLAVTLAYFGHARHGVQLLPVVALGVAAALAPAGLRWPALRSPRLGLALLAALLFAEAVRTATVAASVDGRPVTHHEPFPADEFTDRTVAFH